MLRECAEEGYEWGGVGFIAKTGKCTKTIYRYLLGGGVLLLKKISVQRMGLRLVLVKEEEVKERQISYFDKLFNGRHTRDWSKLSNPT